MDTKELAKTIREKARDKYDGIDLRLILPNFDTIEKLRLLVDTLITEFSKSELKGMWSLANEFKDEDLKKVCNGMINAMNSFYNLLKSEHKVVTIDETPEVADRKFLKTYIINLEDLNYFRSKYIRYDSIIKRYVVSYPDEAERIKKVITETEISGGSGDEDIKDGQDVALVRLISPSDGDEASIQVFPINLIDSLSNNVHIPWGPYELTEFVFGNSSDKLIEITTEELDDRIQDFITRHNVKSIFD